MSEPLLKPGERRKFNESLARCSECDNVLKQMKALGLDTEELDKRLEHQETFIKGVLELDALSQGKQ